MNAPLIISRDPTLLEELQRLAAGAGATPEVVGGVDDAMRRWATAPLVLIGVDAVEEVAAAGPARRVAVHLVGWGRIPDRMFRAALDVGAENLAELPQSDAWLMELFADAGEGAARESTTIAVIGGSGGAGATTFACALGLVAAAGGPAALIDTDPLGPGVDRVLGFDRLEGVRWDALQQTSGRLSARSLRDSLPRRRGLGVLTWSPGPQGTLQAFAAREALSAAARGHDVVVVDAARNGGATVDELMGRCGHVVVVVRGTLSGLTSAARSVALLGDVGSLSVVLRGTAVERAEAARVVGAPVVAEMPDQRGLDEAVDLGLGPLRSRRNVLGRAATETLQWCAEDGSAGPTRRRRPAA